MNHLGCKSEIYDIAVLDDVLLAFEAHLAMVTAGSHRTAGNQRVVGNDFGADEPPGDVAVNLAGRQLCGRLARDRPGAALVLADGEERDVSEQVVAGAD